MLEGSMALVVLSPVGRGLLFFLLGLSVGSFCSVVRHRLPLGWSVVAPGSRCPTCLHPLQPRDMVPVLSYLVLRGRCRHCRMPISPTYVVMELVAGVLAAMAAVAQGWPAGVVALAVWLFANIVVALLERRGILRDESGVTLVETVVALGLLAAVAIPMLDLGANIRGSTPFQRQMAVSLASSKAEELLNYAWMNAPWPTDGSYYLDMGPYTYDLAWTVAPFSSSAPDDFPAEASQLRRAEVAVTCQNCTRPMPAVRVVSILAKP